MHALPLPDELSTERWERQAGALAKARPTLLADALKALQRAHGALDAGLYADELPDSVAEADERLKKLRAENERGLRTLRGEAAAAGSAASKWLAPARKAADTPKPALQAAEAIVRAAATWPGEIDRAAQAAVARVEKRLAELQQAAALAQADQEPEDTPERRRVRARVIDQFRIVKNRPDRKVLFLLCIGHNSCAPYLAATISDAQKPLLTKVLRGDTGFKFFRGECIWEDGGYTFIGNRLSATHARRIERGLLDLTGTRYRIRAREGSVSASAP